MRKAFDLIDENKDGVVTKQELKTLLEGLGLEVKDEVVDQMILNVDQNNDGVI